MSEQADVELGPDIKKQKTPKRNALIKQALSARIVDPNKIFKFVREQDHTLVRSSKRVISPKSMMTAFLLAQKANQNCSSP